MAKKDKKQVVALSYDFGDSAPKVIAKGAGLIAENILKAAKENEIPVYEDPKLAKMLTQLDIGDNIPPELYDIVAQVLVFITDVDDLQERVSKGGNK